MSNDPLLSTPPRRPKPLGLNDMHLSNVPTSPCLHSPKITWRRISNGNAAEPLESSPSSSDSLDLLSKGEAMFNMANTLVGSGVLSVPYAFTLAGYSAVLVVSLVGVLTGFTALLIGQALELAMALPWTHAVPRASRDLTFLGEVAFGAWGRRLVAIIAVVELWLALVTFLVMNGANAKSLLGIDERQAIIGFTMLTAAMLPVPIRVYAHVSLLSLATLLVSSISFLVYLHQLSAWSFPAAENLLSISPGGLFRAYGMLIFCFAGHPCFPALNQSLREAKDWTPSVVVSFVISSLYYTGLGLAAYMALGQALQPCFTANMDVSSPWHTLASVGFLAKIQLTAPLILRAVLSSLQLGLPSEGVASPSHESFCDVVPFLPGTPQTSKTRPKAYTSNMVKAAAGPVLVTLATAASACFLSKDLSALASLVGSALVNLTSVVLPTLLYLRIAFRHGTEAGCTSKLGVMKLAIFVIIIGIGVVTGIAGTLLAAKDLVARRTQSVEELP